MIETLLSNPLFREVSSPKSIDLGSPVLQRKEGYREVLRIWLRFMSAAQLSWKPGTEVYSCGLRDIAQLYEYWAFFKLLGICNRVFEFPQAAYNELFRMTSTGIELSLKAGEAWRIRGVFRRDGQLQVAFSYNKTFSPKADWHECGSWTRPMRPDFTISMWPMYMTRRNQKKRMKSSMFISMRSIESRQSISSLAERWILTKRESIRRGEHIDGKTYSKCMPIEMPSVVQMVPIYFIQAM